MGGKGNKALVVFVRYEPPRSTDCSLRPVDLTMGHLHFGSFLKSR